MNVYGIYVGVYGDVDWDEPLRFRYGNAYAEERLRRDKCPFNKCDLTFRLDKPMVSGDVIKYRYSFNLYIVLIVLPWQLLYVFPYPYW